MVLSFSLSEKKYQTGRFLLIGLWLLILSGLPGSGTLQAQGDNIRVARSLLQPDGTVQVHLVIPRGQSIEDARLVTGENTIALDIAPVALPVTRWLLLDAGQTMINIAPSVQDAVSSLVAGGTRDNTQTGAIRFAEDLTVLQPAESRVQVEDWLDDYTARADDPGCLSDALTWLRDRELTPERLHRVLIITGGLTRQGLCNTEGYVNTGIPLDVLVISDTVDAFYYDITERSGGTLYRANLQTIRTRLAEVQTQWARPAFVLTGSIPDTGTLSDERVRLRVTLSSGDEISQILQLESLTTDQTVAESGLTLSGIPTDTPIPTNTPQASPTITQAVSTDSPATASVTDESETTTQTTAPPDPTAETDPAVTDLSQTAPVTTERLATSPPADESTDVAVVPASPAENLSGSPTPPSPSNPEPDSSPGNVSRLIILAGGAAAIIVVVGVILLLRRNSSTPSIDAPGELTQIEMAPTQVQTIDSREANTPSSEPSGGFYARNMDDPDDELDLTEILDEDEEDEFDKTEIVTAEDMLMASQQTVAGELRGDDNDTVYKIHAPQTILGRAESCDIVMQGDSQISRQHLQFTVDEVGQVYVESLTQNPVLLDGELLDERQPLNDGSQLQLSLNTRVTYHAADDS